MYVAVAAHWRTKRQNSSAKARKRSSKLLEAVAKAFERDMLSKKPPGERGG
jgi:hypothetical protein